MRAALYSNTAVSVPLNASGLTNGATYHLVISQGNAADPANNTQVVITQSSSGGGTPHYKVGAGAWQTFAGITNPGIPITLYSGTTRRLVHTWEDAGNRWTWQVPLNGQTTRLGAYGEATANGSGGPVVGSFRIHVYDATGILVALI